MKEALLILPSYFAWHYSRALREYTNNARNVLVFTNHFFSIGLLLKTFFAPWRRLDIVREGKETFAGLFDRLVVNSIMRIVGMIMRSFMIGFGSFVWIGAAVVFAGGLLFWLVLPIVVLALFLYGLSLMFI